MTFIPNLKRGVSKRPLPVSVKANFGIAKVMPELKPSKLMRGLTL
jgi:hypothetical protein